MPAPAGSAETPPPLWLYGQHAVAAALANPARPCRRLVATRNAARRLAPILAAARAAGHDRPEPEILERRDLDRLLGPDSVHQGLAMHSAALERASLTARLPGIAACPEATLVMLDRVTDPHNVGAVMRSAAAFGAAGLILQARHAPHETPVLAKAASGALEHVPVFRVTNLGRCLAELGAAGFTATGLSEHARAELALLPRPAHELLVLGAEGTGLRPGVAAKCSRLARLPAPGPLATLNVSNAAAIALYERVRGG